MTATIFQAKVRDYSTWKKAFDSMQDIRTSKGAITDHIYRDADDPNKIIAILKWSSISNARSYFSSAEFKAALAKSGTEGQPILEYVKDA
jgi:heme-degrading monooxygenase HmoA